MRRPGMAAAVLAALRRCAGRLRRDALADRRRAVAIAAGNRRQPPTAPLTIVDMRAGLRRPLQGRLLDAIRSHASRRQRAAERHVEVDRARRRRRAQPRPRSAGRSRSRSRRASRNRSLIYAKIGQLNSDVDRQRSARTERTLASRRFAHGRRRRARRHHALGPGPDRRARRRRCRRTTRARSSQHGSQVANVERSRPTADAIGGATKASTP